MSYPPSLVEMASCYGPASLGHVVASWGAERLRPFRRRPRDTFEGALMTKFGRKLFDDFYRPYAQKLWGLPPADISSVAAEQRAQRFSPRRAFTDVARWLTSSESKHSFFYPADGFNAVSRSFESRLLNMGVKIFRDTQVKSLQFNPSRSRVESLSVARKGEAGGEADQFATDWVISTAPLHFNLSLLGDSDSKPLNPYPRLRYRHLRLVYLMTENRPVTHGETLYLPGTESRFGRVSFPFRYRKQPEPEPRLQPVVVEAPCSNEDEVWRMTENEIVALCKKDLLELGIFRELRIQACKSIQVPNVYPIYEMGWETELRRAMEYQGRFENFVPVGRSALFLHCNIDHCISMGMTLAQTLGNQPNPKNAWTNQLRGFQDFTPHE